jgi:hypothetical protein
MTKTDFKKNLINRIREIDDERILEEIYRLLDSDNDDFGTLSLSEQQKDSIHQGQQDIQNGNSLPHNQANKEVGEWLKK